MKHGVQSQDPLQLLLYCVQASAKTPKGLGMETIVFTYEIY